MLRGLGAAVVVATAFFGPGACRDGHSPQASHLLEELRPQHAPDSSLLAAELMMKNRPNVRGSASALALVQEGGADRELKAAHKDEEKEQMMVAGTVDPSFWMWKTTPAPPPIPGPNPQLMWVAHTGAPDPTSPPAYENCYGCDCILVYDLDVVQGGSIPDKYTCFGGPPSVHVPALKWAGVPENSGKGHPVLAADGTECLKSKSFALTMQDLDFPYGTGQHQNRVKNMLWVANIPGDWTELDETMAHQTYKEKPLVVVGKNEEGGYGMEAPCPQYGVHRYAFTFWVLKDYLGTENNPLDPNTAFDDIVGLLEEKELARFVFYGTVHAQGYKPKSFLQQIKEWF